MSESICEEMEKCRYPEMASAASNLYLGTERFIQLSQLGPLHSALNDPDSEDLSGTRVFSMVVYAPGAWLWNDGNVLDGT